MKKKNLDNYLKKLFCQGYCFNFFSSQNSFFLSYNSIVLVFSLIRAAFYFSIYKMVDSEYSANIYKFLIVSIGAIMTNYDILKFVPDHVKTIKICKNAVKK